MHKMFALVSNYGVCIMFRSHRWLGSYRMYIKYFLTKTKLSTCSDLKTAYIAYQNFGLDKSFIYALFRWRFSIFSKMKGNE